MKRFAISVCLLLAATGVWAQTFVSTTPEKRTALIEEFTGVQCTYCPLGHKATDQMKAMFPGKVLAINIHQGWYASTYASSWGNALATQAGVTGYPSATMNRHAFGSTGIQINPGEFYPRTLEVLQMESPVNVAAVVDIDESTRLMTVTVEVYYTSNSAKNTNMLNVAVLQDNVLGPQVGGSMFYPENMVGSQYRHNHMLRDLLTGQWGDTISQTTAGSFTTRTYQYVIPRSLNGAEIANMDDLSVLVFVAEDHKEVLTAAEAVRKGSHPRLTLGDADNEDCSTEYQPYVRVVNATEHTVQDIHLDVDGVELVSNKVIDPYVTDTIHLPAYSITMPVDSMNYAVSRTVNISQYASQGHTVNPPAAPLTFNYADVSVYTVKAPLTFTIRYDEFPGEVTFSLVRMADCSTFFTHTGTNEESRQQVSYTLEPEDLGLYRFEIGDVGGDGLSGNISLTDADGHVLFSKYASSLMRWMWYTNLTAEGMAIEERDAMGAGCRVYPNPATDRLRIGGVEEVLSAEVLNVEGKRVASASGAEVNVSHLEAGVYFVRVATREGMTVRKFVKR